MKTTLLALAILVLAACGKNGGGAAVTPSLVGTWQSAHTDTDGGHARWVFSANSSWKEVVVAADGSVDPSTEINGTYTLSGSTLTLNPSNTTPVVLPSVSFADANTFYSTSPPPSDSEIWKRQ